MNTTFMNTTLFGYVYDSEKTKCHRKKGVFSLVLNWNRRFLGIKARFVDRRNDLQCTCAERDKNR